MQANRPENAWNPQIAIAVVALGILAALWLNMAKLRLGLGQPEHDLSHVPLAQNVTSDEIEELQNGKPLSLILADRPDYEKIASVPEAVRPASPPPVDDRRGDRGQQPRPTLSRQIPPGSSTGIEAAVVPVDGIASDRQPGLPRGEFEVAPVGFTTETPAGKPPIVTSAAGLPAARTGSNSELPTGHQPPPQSVPRANPAGDLDSARSGSFLEKFPGQSQQLPNIKFGPNSPPSVKAATRLTFDRPNATELTPPPFGDLSLKQTSNPAVETAETSIAGPVPSARPPRDGETARAAWPSSSPPGGPREKVSSVAVYPTITAGPSESWWTLAQRAYDDGRLFEALYDFNRAQFPDYDLIQAGAKVSCPPREVLLASSPAGASLGEGRPGGEPSSAGKSREYRTRRGETLFEIARQQLGQASRFIELEQLNRDRLPAGAGHLTPLPAGIDLDLPTR